MQFTRTRYGLITALLIGMALMLTGCGGDDNGGLSAENQARIDNAEAAATAAEARAMAAAAAQAEAEADAADAHAAHMAAEAEAMAAKAAQATAEAAQAAAEANATAAVAAQAVAESEARMAMADLTEAQEDLEAAEMAQEEAEEAEAAAKTALAVAQSEAKAAKEAQAMAMAAETAAKAAQMAAETARDDYKTKLAAAETARDEYKMKYEEATAVPAVGTQVGAMGRADSWRIATAVSPATPEPDKSESATVEMKTARIKSRVKAAELKRDADGVVSFTVMEGSLDRMTTADDMADTDAPALTGWHGTALEKTANGTMQNALVYTNIERSVTPFSSRYPYNVNDDGTDTLAAHTQLRVLGIPTAATAGQIPLTEPTKALISDLDDKISIKDGLSSDLITRSFGTTYTGTDAVNAVVTLPGSYNGVEGRYRCVGTCVLTWTADGTTIHSAAVGTDGTGLLFKADDISTLLPDPDYQTFGVWMIAQDGPVTGNDGMIRPIAKANAGMFDQEELAGDGIRGSATYKGQAAGYYATRNAGSFEAKSGRFTATATLMANFDAAKGTVPSDLVLADVLTTAGGAGTLDPKPLNMSRGSVAATATAATAGVRYYRPVVASAGVDFTGSKIDKFMDEDGTMMGGWVVNLDNGALRRPSDVMVADTLDDNDGATIFDDSDVAGQMSNAYNAALKAVRDAGLFEGTTSGTSGAMEWKGVWEASLHGNTKTALPTSVVGTFQADVGDEIPKLNDDGAINRSTDLGFAGVIGSFGARR